MKLVIKKEIYDLKNGIGLLKTLYGDNYDTIPQDFKDECVRKEWDKYQGIPKKLYKMSRSEDPEVLELCSKMLDEKKVEHYKQHKNIWDITGVKENVLHSIKVFLTEQDKRWNSYK